MLDDLAQRRQPARVGRREVGEDAVVLPRTVELVEGPLERLNSSQVAVVVGQRDGDGRRVCGSSSTSGS